MSKRKNPSQVAAVVSAMWMLFSLVSDLVRHMRELGCSIVEIGESFYALAQEEGQDALRQIALIIAEVGHCVYLVAVDCTMPLADMIALGQYDFVHKDITAENFPVEGKVKSNTAMRLFHFDRNMTTPAIEAEMDKEGWKPASIWHLLFFGAKYPELQKQFAIIALGSVCNCLVVYLNWNDVFCERSLRLLGVGGNWDSQCCFLAVPKDSQV